jgi:Ni/Co efflux regulator RcnB
MKTSVAIFVLFCAFGLAVQAENSAEAHYLRGQRFLRHRHYKGAHESFTAAIVTARENGTSHPKAHYQRGKIFEEYHHDYQAAIRDYQAYLHEPDEDRADALKRLASVCFKLGQIYRRLFNTAVNIQIDYYTNKLELAEFSSDFASSDELPYHRYFRASCYYLAGRFSESIADLKRLPEQTPVSDLAQVKLAASYYRVGEKKQANRIFATLNDERALVKSELWRASLECGRQTDMVAAQHECQKALNALLSQEPDAIGKLNRLRRNLSFIYYASGEIQKALELLSEIDSTIPDFRPTFTTVEGNVTENYSSSYTDPSIFQLKKQLFFDFAHTIYTQLLSIKESTNTRLQIGRCYLYTNRLDAARQIFSQIDRPEAKVYLGVVVYLSEGLEEAREIWDSLPVDKQVKEQIDFQMAELGVNIGDLSLQENDVPTQLTGYIYLQKGIYDRSERRTVFLVKALEHFEEDESEPTIRLINQFEANYHRAYYDAATYLGENLAHNIPEAIQIWNYPGLIKKMKLRWPQELGRMPLPDWMPLNYSSKQGEPNR